MKWINRIIASAFQNWMQKSAVANQQRLTDRKLDNAGDAYQAIFSGLYANNQNNTHYSKTVMPTWSTTTKYRCRWHVCHNRVFCLIVNGFAFFVEQRVNDWRRKQQYCLAGNSMNQSDHKQLFRFSQWPISPQHLIRLSLNLILACDDCVPGSLIVDTFTSIGPWEIRSHDISIKWWTFRLLLGISHRAHWLTIHGIAWVDVCSSHRSWTDEHHSNQILNFILGNQANVNASILVH